MSNPSPATGLSRDQFTRRMCASLMLNGAHKVPRHGLQEIPGEMINKGSFSAPQSARKIRRLPRLRSPGVPVSGIAVEG